MDLHTVTALHRPRDRTELAAHLRPGAAPLAGGTWLFSEPQPHLDALVDLTTLGWPPLTEEPDGGLTIAATCTIAELVASGEPLSLGCARALVGSFKIWHSATVGGNLCLALPAGPMTSLCAGLDGVAVLWAADGSTRRVPVAGFVTGVRRTRLAPGEVLRAVEIPAAARAGRAVFRRATLTVEGRSGAVLIGRADADGSFILTLTAATDRPYRFPFPAVPGRVELQEALDTVPEWYDDPHGAPRWREHMSRRLAEEIREELA